VPLFDSVRLGSSFASNFFRTRSSFILEQQHNSDLHQLDTTEYDRGKDHNIRTMTQSAGIVSRKFNTAPLRAKLATTSLARTETCSILERAEYRTCQPVKSKTFLQDTDRLLSVSQFKASQREPGHLLARLFAAEACTKSELILACLSRHPTTTGSRDLN
jgi:hypothetical protein